MPSRSPRFQLLQVRLGRDLSQYVARRRPARNPDSWRAIAADLREVTGVDVSHETLRAWFRDDDLARTA